MIVIKILQTGPFSPIVDCCSVIRWRAKTPDRCCMMLGFSVDQPVPDGQTGLEIKKLNMFSFEDLKP